MSTVVSSLEEKNRSGVAPKQGFTRLNIIEEGEEDGSGEEEAIDEATSSKFSRIQIIEEDDEEEGEDMNLNEGLTEDINAPSGIVEIDEDVPSGIVEIEESTIGAIDEIPVPLNREVLTQLDETVVPDAHPSGEKGETDATTGTSNTTGIVEYTAPGSDNESLHLDEVNVSVEDESSAAVSHRPSVYEFMCVCASATATQLFEYVRHIHIDTLENLFVSTMDETTFSKLLSMLPMRLARYDRAFKSGFLPWAYTNSPLSRHSSSLCLTMLEAVAKTPRFSLLMMMAEDSLKNGKTTPQHSQILSSQSWVVLLRGSNGA